MGLGGGLAANGQTGGGLTATAAQAAWNGYLLPQRSLGESNLTLTASRTYLHRFVPPVALTVDRVAWMMTAANGSNDNCDVGVYDANLNKLVSAGATAGKLNATGLQSVAFAATALVAGTVYYVAFATGTFATTAGNCIGTNTQVPASGQNIGELFGAGAPNQLFAFQSAAAPLGATVALSFDNGQVPALALRTD